MLVLARGVLWGGLQRSSSPVLLPMVDSSRLGAVIVAHGGVAWLAQHWSDRGVGDTIDTLRTAALHARGTGTRAVQEQSGHWRAVLTTDWRTSALPQRFLPALVSVVLATPAALLVVFLADPVSGVLALVTVPLIPVFMVLIGTLTRAHTQRRLRITSALGGQLADLLSGALTLRALDATEGPAREVESGGRRHADSTMSVLRLAFLSSFALEFIATLSVALVAVGIGLRLLDGSIPLAAGLIALIIVPEVYSPIRRVGTSFHAAVDGLTAVDEVLPLIDAPSPAPYTPERQAGVGLRIEDLSVRSRDGVTPAQLSVDARPGAVTVLHGPNGSGKSTVFLAVLGVLPEELVDGRIIAPEPEVIDYLPARPVLVPGTVADNLALLGAPPRETGVDIGVPAGQRLGAHSTGISAGQGQRLALSRTLARGDGGPRLLLSTNPRPPRHRARRGHRRRAARGRPPGCGGRRHATRLWPAGRRGVSL